MNEQGQNPESSNESSMTKQLPILVGIIFALVLLTGWAFKGSSTVRNASINEFAPSVSAFGYNGVSIDQIVVKNMNVKDNPVQTITDVEQIQSILAAMAVTTCEPVPGEGGWRIRLFAKSKRIAALYVLPDGHWGHKGHYGKAPALAEALKSLSATQRSK